METQTPTNYMLLFRSNETLYAKLSAEETQKVLTAWKGWFEGLAQQGKVVSGHPLERGGQLVSAKDGVIADGPFVESKETIGGYFFLTNVSGMDEAVAIAKRCPGLPHGAVVEVRAVAHTCPSLRAMEEKKLAEAAA